MTFLRRVAALIGGLALGLAGPAFARDVDQASYGYPLVNPFEATIATTPPDLRPQLPSDDDIRQSDYALKLRPEREYELPSNFWPVKKLHYRLAWQKHEAPLVFIIAGTGANYSSTTPEYLKRLFYNAGYHVVQLSSPTSWDFMVGASHVATPGYTPDDADDLYRVMQAVRAQHPDLPVSDYYLTGYSLGALHAAFVSKLDETRRSFNFKRVLLLNPPVNLYTSISNLDKMVQTEVKGINDTNTFYQVILAKLTRYFNQKGYVDLNDAFLFDLQQSKQHLSNEEMAMLIGAVFRFSSADIAFTSDLINRRGLITPPKYPITEGTSLTPFFKRAMQCDFECYMTDQLMPLWRAKYDGGSLPQLIQQVSLYALEDYLRDSPKIAVMHNADDVILGPGDIGFLRRTFGDRLTLYPRGGHCGNLNYRVNAQDMLGFLKGQDASATGIATAQTGN
ncbi:serine/threonine protein kinase [Pseudomonas nicosulfuronedens]|uniref:Serine/threonine protein kinase n=1 Tax=Pseudomonas nicosulfuronedens TaxID=2571105 RepID=A0A5R9RAJ5_9PSED|nr:serine/threonine protein kinase [Pseudomonas nicosulfuronedens]MDH1012058.1 serine/threonine protein kinase [Pseudomonas nicosulfuronedens]MDH1980574.1 serine/threonine protein kinase [Pseudomonas nicosulfuronedens]MDH2027524.1 serine/threonine protein kinase [Pseudomonas nicosulfuronedens]TLX70918.1 serine/threonine protein kinase [Pseudomonas nicosulfuronedens]